MHWVRGLPRMRRPGPWLPEIARQRLRPRQAPVLQRHAARLLPIVRGPTRGTEGCLPGRPRHLARAGAPVGAFSADPAALGWLAAQPKLRTPVLEVVHRVITRHLLGQAGLKADEADSGAVTPPGVSLSARRCPRQVEPSRRPPVTRCDSLGIVAGCAMAAADGGSSQKSATGSKPRRRQQAKPRRDRGQYWMLAAMSARGTKCESGSCDSWRSRATRSCWN